MDALAFLARPIADLGTLYVVHGDEAFLKREALQALRHRAFGESPEDAAHSTHAGDKAAFSDVMDELETIPFFSPRRMVVVENGDPFVTKNRSLLEKRIEHLPAKGILVLDVKTWAANTRLAKMTPDAGNIACKAQPPYKMPQWCVDWAKGRHQKQLPLAAAQLLVDLIGPEMGLLDQEIAKLSTYVGAKAKIEAEDVDRLVGSSRAESTWKIFDAIGQGNAREALGILDRLFEQGEEPMRMLGAFAMQLRRLAQATRLSTQGVPLSAALQNVGVPPFGVKNAESQLRHLGRPRAEKLYDMLLSLNMGLRGESPLPERTQFEKFILTLARKA
ncbi:MAG: DNA polymerase III subunit delta [Gemmataceae bacterium]|nr:DNA polymerase III subunit delta [Gemmataceae bacterium]